MRIKILLAVATLLGSTFTAAAGSLIAHYYTKHRELAEYLSQYNCAIHPELVNLQSIANQATNDPMSYTYTTAVPMLESVVFETQHMPINLRTKLLRIQNQKQQLDIASVNIRTTLAHENRNKALERLTLQAKALEHDLQSLTSEIGNQC